MDDLRVAFGQRLRELRKQRRLSQEELAFRAGVHRNYYAGIERAERNPGFRNVCAIAEALEVSLAELFSPFRTVPRR